MKRNQRSSYSPLGGVMRSLCAVFCVALGSLLAVPSDSLGAMIFDSGTTETVDTVVNDNGLVQDSPGGDATTVDLTVGGQIGGDVRVEDSSQLNLTGGTVAVDLLAVNDANLFIASGTVTRFLRTAGNARATIRGGSIGGPVGAEGFSRVQVRGGTFGDSLVASSSGVLTVYGTDFQIDGMPVGDGPILTDGTLTGTLQFNVPINNPVVRTGNGQIFLVDTAIIPEPATAALLLGIAGCGLAFRHR